MSAPTFRQRAAYLRHFFAATFRHPLNREHFWQTAWRFFSWHVGSRLLSQPVVYPFVNQLRMYIGTGMWGATGVVHMGLQEFSDMAFCAHFLRPGDVFVDVGACYGTYTLLASGAAGAHTLSFEPDPVTNAALVDNVRLNHLEDRVSVFGAVVGDREGRVRFTAGLRDLNHVVEDGSEAQASLTLDQTTIDHALAGRDATMIKVDAEGYESRVIAGAAQTLVRPSVLAVLVEDAFGLGARFGTPAGPHERMLEHGFSSYDYDPMRRQLRDLGGRPNREGYNTLYLREPEKVAARLKSAAAIRVRGIML